tara:strand:+ start:2410 stop:4251 length:1842 start_codon:yes stop_codon:yes gene_type:complete
MVLITDERANGVWIPGYDSDDKPPTIDEIMTLYKDGRQYFQGFHAQCQMEEDYYLGKRIIPVPEGIDPVWPATATTIVNVGTDHVDVNNLQIDVPSVPRSRARAERIKKFYIGSWLNIKKPVLRTAVRQSFLYGIAFLKSMFDGDKWPDVPIIGEMEDDEYASALKDWLHKRSIVFPLDIDVINPKFLIWDDSKIRMKWAIEFSQRYPRDLQRRYPEWAAERTATTMYEWIEYWDETWVAYIADKEFVWGPHKHGYGHIPYTQVLPAHSYTFEDDVPQVRYRGILLPIHDLLDEEARLIAQIDTLIRTVAYRTLDFHGPQAIAEKAAEEYELFGGKNVVPPNVEVAISPMATVPPDLYQQLNIVQSKIEEATFPNVVRGVRPRGVSAGFAMSVLAGMGRLVFQGVADGLRHSLEQVNSKLAQLLENKVRGRLTVHARSDIHNFDQTIGPDDIRGYYENAVQIKAEAPEEREREALLALRLHAAGVISLYEAQRRAGVINPLEEQMQIRAEQLLNSPEVMQSMAAALMQTVGLPQQMEQAVSPGGGTFNPGAQNMGGPQLQRVGEANIQQARTATNRGEPSVFPQGMGGLDALASRLGGAPGGAQGMPSGQTVR